MGDTFEPDMTKLFCTLVNGKRRVLDVGANIGCTTLLFAQLADKVVSFEPSLSTYEFLKANIASSGFDHIELHNVGLGKEDEDLTLTFDRHNRSGGFISSRVQALAEYAVEKVSIRKGDTYLASITPPRKTVDFVKIDVEGFELDVLQGLTATLERDRPVVILEMNHWCLNAFQRISIPDFLDTLGKVFPLLYAVHGDQYRDLHNLDNRYFVMYRHILFNEFSNLVGAFQADQLNEFYSVFSTI